MQHEPSVPARLDWASARAGRYRGRNVVVLHLPSSTSERYGSRAFTRSTFDQFLDDTNMTRLSRRGKAVPAPQATCARFSVVRCTRGLVVSRDARVLAALNPEQVDETRASLGLRSEIDLYVVAGTDARGLRLADVIQRSASGGLACGAIADYVDARPANPLTNTFAYMSVDGDATTSPPIGSTVIVDQNILIDAERSIRTDPSRHTFSQVRDELVWLQCMDCVPGFGIAECREQGSAERSHVLRLAWGLWMSANLASVDRSILGEELAHRVRQSVREPSTSPLKGEGSAILVSFVYLGVLKAAELWADERGRKFIPRRRLDAYLEWLRYVNQPWFGVSGYLWAVVQRLFLSTGEEHASSIALLKFARNPNRNDLMGAAWDLVYPTVVDMASAGLISEIDASHIYLLTADRPLRKTRAGVRVAGALVQRTGQGTVLGVLSFPAADIHKIGPRQREEILRAHLELEEGMAMRAQSGPDYREIGAEIERLESNLGLAKVS